MVIFIVMKRESKIMCYHRAAERCKMEPRAMPEKKVTHVADTSNSKTCSWFEEIRSYRWYIGVKGAFSSWGCTHYRGSDCNIQLQSIDKAIGTDFAALAWESSTVLLRCMYSRSLDCTVSTCRQQCTDDGNSGRRHHTSI